MNSTLDSTAIIVSVSSLCMVNVHCLDELPHGPYRAIYRVTFTQVEVLLE